MRKFGVLWSILLVSFFALSCASCGTYDGLQDTGLDDTDVQVGVIEQQAKKDKSPAICLDANSPHGLRVPGIRMEVMRIDVTAVSLTKINGYQVRIYKRDEPWIKNIKVGYRLPEAEQFYIYDLPAGNEYQDGNFTILESQIENPIVLKKGQTIIIHIYADVFAVWDDFVSPSIKVTGSFQKKLFETELAESIIVF